MEAAAKITDKADSEIGKTKRVEAAAKIRVRAYYELGKR